jgi:hypothetical protein
MDDENPYAAPQVELDDSGFVLEGDPSIVRKGRKLIVPEGAMLPTRCVKCNRPTHKQMTVKVSSGFTARASAMCFLTLIGGVILLLFLVYHEISLLWMIPPVGASSVMICYLQRDAPRPIRTTFYVCSKHYLINQVASVVGFLLVLPIFVRSWLEDYIEFDVRDFYNFQYFIVLAVIVCFISPLSFRINGKRRHPTSCEFQGFGKKYLESFPESGNA